MAYYGNEPSKVAVTVGQGVIDASHIEDASISTLDISNDAITPNKIDDDGTGFQMGSLGLGGAVSGEEKLTVTGTASFSGDVTISSGKGLIVSWAEGTNSGSYISQFYNLDSTNNQSNGILIQAGAGASDKALAVRNYAGTDMFIVKGDKSATFAGTITSTATNSVHSIGTSSGQAIGGNYTTLGLNGTNGSGISCQVDGTVGGYCYTSTNGFYFQSAGRDLILDTSGTTALTIDNSTQNATFAGAVTQTNSGDQALTIVSTNYNDASVVLQRGTGSDDYMDRWLTNDGGAFKLKRYQNDGGFVTDFTINTSGNATFGGAVTITGASGGILNLQDVGGVIGKIVMEAVGDDKTMEFNIATSATTGGWQYSNNGGDRFFVGNNGDINCPASYSNSIGGDTHRNLNVRDDGRLGVNTSSERYKKKITDISDTSWVYDLRPVDFEWKTTDKKDWGLIAEEVIKVKPELVGIENDLPEWINYDKLIPVLLKEIQEQNKRIEALENA